MHKKLLHVQDYLRERGINVWVVVFADDAIKLSHMLFHNQNLVEIARAYRKQKKKEPFSVCL